ncbi:MAG: ABC transporter permease subunit [Acetobacteraceae bacterium]|nr:ABC transporter permease subunit [Acetobacteraceae bacterium]
MGPADRGAASWSALARLGGFAGFLAVWWLVSLLTHASPGLLPSPLRVGAFAWREIAAGEMPMQIAATLARVLVSFVLAMTAGTIAGYAMGRSARLNALFDSWLVITLNLPLLVLVILVYIWIGLNDTAAILAVVAAKAPAVTVIVREGTRALDRGLDEVATVFRVPVGRRLRAIVLPQLAPYLAAAGRSGLSIIWKIVLVVELLGRPNGVGYALNLYFQNFDVTAILAYGFVFAAIMLVMEGAVLQPVERRIAAWRVDA